MSRRTERTSSSHIVGREDELVEITATLAAGRDLLLEGPPGTSKSTLLRAVAETSGSPFELVEGSADLTPVKLIGYHDPAGVIARGYREEDFVPGPLIRMMRDGGLLYIEEFNRVPEDTLNVLLGPLAERNLTVPRLGTVRANAGFRLVGAMNPFDNVGTMRVSQSVYDRLCRLSVTYQSESEEREIVHLATAGGEPWLVECAVSIVRATREHPEVRIGSSVRGAIDLVLVTERLSELRKVDMSAGYIGDVSREAGEVVLDAAMVSLSGRLLLDESATRTPEDVVRELWEDILLFPSRRVTSRGKTLALENAVNLRSARPKRKPRGPVVSTPRIQTDRSGYPKPGRIDGESRVFGSDEMAILASERAAGPASRGLQDIRRDNPMARDALSEDGTLDTEALRALFEKDSDAAIRFVGDLLPHAPDEELREIARRMALEIVVRIARRTPTASSGPGKLKSIRYRFNSDDLDLDRTLEEISGKPYPDYDDFWVVERVRSRKAYALLLDVSGSMRGEKLIHVALAAGALARSIPDDELSVVLFWRDAAVVKGITQQKPLATLLDDILAARARGLTNLRLGLEVGLRELERSTNRDREAIVFTDGLHNIGEDPLPVVERFTKLHVIGTSLEERHVRACRDLAFRGGGRCVFVGHMEDIPEAVSHCLS